MLNKTALQLGTSRSVIRELFEYGKQIEKERGAENVFDFSIGNPNVPAPDCVRESIEKNLRNPDIHAYTSASGALSVRQKVAEFYNKSCGFDMSADDIYITYGAAAALSITFLAINGGNNEFIVIAPYFPEYKVFVESCGGKLVTVSSREDFSLDLDGIRGVITEKTAAVIINTPNNPVGNIYTQGEIEGLAEILRAKSAEYGHPIYLVSDEPYREITYGTEVPNVFLSYDDTVICYSFSKSLSLAGERIGYVVVSPKCRERAELNAAICGAGRALGYVCAPSLFQYVIADCLGKTADISVYRHNRDLIYTKLTGLGFTCIKPQGAFYLFVKCPIEPDKFFEICKDEGVLVVPSESFGTPGWVRIAYCVSTDLIVRSLPHFEKIAEKCRSI